MSPGKLKTANNHIERNALSYIGHGYHGSPAILAVKTQDTLIAHNDITHMPHAGIVVYGGSGAKRLRILNNHISHTLELLADGGGIYVASTQGTSAETGALIDGNVVQDTITPYNFGIYTDYGAAWTVISNNVIFRADNPVAIQTAPPLMNVTVKNNFWDSVPYGSDNVPSGIKLEDNTLYVRDTFEAKVQSNAHATAIMRGAGRAGESV